MGNSDTAGWEGIMRTHLSLSHSIYFSKYLYDMTVHAEDEYLNRSRVRMKYKSTGGSVRVHIYNQLTTTGFTKVLPYSFMLIFCQGKSSRRAWLKL